MYTASMAPDSASFAKSVNTGTPPCRALAMDFPEDERLREVDYAWLAGERLLVVPFRAGMSELTMPLPPGVWCDFRTGERHSGEVTLKPELGELPILVRENSVIPLADPVEFVENGMQYQLTLRVYGSAPEPARLFADDGWSFDYEDAAVPAWGTVDADGTLSAGLGKRYSVKAVERL